MTKIVLCVLQMCGSDSLSAPPARTYQIGPREAVASINAFEGLISMKPHVCLAEAPLYDNLVQVLMCILCAVQQTHSCA